MRIGYNNYHILKKHTLRFLESQTIMCGARNIEMPDRNKKIMPRSCDLGAILQIGCDIIRDNYYIQFSFLPSCWWRKRNIGDYGKMNIRSDYCDDFVSIILFVFIIFCKLEKESGWNPFLLLQQHWICVKIWFVSLSSALLLFLTHSYSSISFVHYNFIRFIIFNLIYIYLLIVNICCCYFFFFTPLSPFILYYTLLAHFIKTSRSAVRKVLRSITNMLGICNH